MTVSDIIAALDLPSTAMVERRVPKKLLLENEVPSTSDKRYVKAGVEELYWIAALKPTTIGVSEYNNTEREYLEVSVLRFTLRSGAKLTRLIELVHRAVPYPLLLVTEHAGQVNLSAAHKRWAQNEADKIVIDGDIVTVDLDIGRDAPLLREFRSALALEHQPHGNLHALYQGWVDTLVSYKAAQLTGSFKLSVNTRQAVERQEALRECTRLETEIAHIRAAASKEKQMARKVELNMELKRIEAAHASARARL